jgi:uncharacterized protein YvpB
MFIPAKVSESHAAAEKPDMYGVLGPMSYEMRLINQNEIGLRHGCEAVSAAMLLSKYGYIIDPHDLVDNYLRAEPMPRNGIGGNPNYAYIGDPRISGFGVFAQGVTDMLNKYLEGQNSPLRAVNVSGLSNDELFAYVYQDTPVIVWTTMNMMGIDWYRTSWRTPDGRLIRWPSNQHCCVLADFDDNTVTLFDPLVNGVETQYDRRVFLYRWNEVRPYYEDRNSARQAVVIKPIAQNLTRG